jgi:hypothetical protein
MPTATPSRVKELRETLQTKAQEIEGLSSAWKDETGNGHFVLSPEQKSAYQKAVNDAIEIKDLLATEEKANGIFDFLNQPQGPSVGGTDAGAMQRSGFQGKSLADLYIGSEAYADMKAHAFRRPGDAVVVETGIRDLAKIAQVKDVYSALGGDITIPVIGQAQSLGWTERTLRPGRVRDLFPSERTNATTLYGIRETGYINRAAVVSQRTSAAGGPATGGPTDVFGLKPRSDITITSYSVGISTIAHIMYVHRETLNDEPRLRGLLDRDMIDGVKMVEDQQLLYGDGVGDNILGLTQQPGIQTYAGLATDRRSAQIRRAMTRAILAYFAPTGVVLHPLDWEDLELETDTTGAYTIATSVAVGGERRVWRMNVVDTPAMTEGRFLLGAFGTGAKVYDREEVRIDLSTENRDMFERNAYTLRCEERLGLVVDRPESFVYGTITTPDAAHGG